MRRQSLLLLLVLLAAAKPATAESLDGRLGITAKAGALVPLKDDFVSSTTHSNPGVAAGGGIIFGLGRNFAGEIDVTHVPGLDVEISGAKAYEARLTDVSLGVQYRFLPAEHLVPYVGGGVDFITGELKHVSGADYDLEWTEGGHVNLGFDYFLTPGIAFTGEARGIFPFDGDVTGPNGKVGTYRPMAFVGTLGFRLMLPAHVFRDTNKF
ncbi:outer membrane beta-barrel protein [Geomesophilobacter sediminis]|uniref:Porin family protein n=1 Tax=Geomesophilobacter sediminis TaxID=2798584 RepID=A0A8J7JE58_9BACT|nr:outer membrane beta-barrel protein [Geomesophilobacter sediminis]MBJ6725723.1 porin family protein [Geomesophilobacter sediminis]